MDDIWKLMAGGAAFGVIAGFWTRIKDFVWRIFSLFIQQVEITSPEAHAARSRLATRNIEAVVTDDLGAEIIAGGGIVKLQVRQEDAERAAQILARRRRRRHEQESALPGDQLAARAVNAAILGLYFFPVVLHLYSALLLLRLRMSGLELRARVETI